MALSLLSQHPSVLDFQQFFDTSVQQSQQSPYQSNYLQLNKDNILQMEYQQNINHQQQQQQHHHHHHHQSQQHQTQQQQQIVNSGTSNKHNNNNCNTNNNNDSNTEISQNIVASRNYISGYHHQHIGTDYEQVINFVDSPPNSEESWPDEPAKGSPGPQIIEIQTIFSTHNSRKRRMDWDSLNISHNENSTNTQSRELTHKSLSEKDRQKREKLTDRGSWTDDIGFDLNAEFNSNSYLNNEPFLSFSPALTVPKQEPQSEHQLKSQKSPINSAVEGGVLKVDKTIQSPNHVADNNHKNELNDAACGCDSPQSTQCIYDATTNNVDKHGSEQNSPLENNSTSYNHAKYQSNRNNAGCQQLSVIDTSKIEHQAINSSANGNNNNNSSAIYSDEHKFQYILAAATSIATKNNEETLTYLNQGQSYEIKLKKIGDLSLYRDKILKSVIKICFHERRLQFMEREQMQLWQASRPGERIIEVDVPLSYGLCHVSQQLTTNSLNTVEVFWDPLKEVGVYIKVNCISTEFTAKKHGGEKGVPFRLQIETYIENTHGATNTATVAAAATAAECVAVSGATGDSLAAAVTNNVSQSATNALTPNSNHLSNKQLVHAAACQIKVFKLKGADRKHKQDREKVLKRPQSEQDKFQPSYECTIMNDIPLDIMLPNNACLSPEYMKIWPNSPVHIPKYDGILPYTANTSPAANNSSPIAINSVTSTNSPTMKLMDGNIVSPTHISNDMEEYSYNIMPDSTPVQVAQWLNNHRLTTYMSTFAHFSGSDIMRMSKEDLIQICGLADGIRMFNILRAKPITPRLTLYVSFDGSSYHAIYLISHTAKELTHKLFKIPGFFEMIANGGNNTLDTNGGNSNFGNSWGMQSKYSGSGTNIFQEVVYLSGPAGVHVTVTDDVLSNEIKDGSLYCLEVQNGKVVMKFANQNDN